MKISFDPEADALCIEFKNGKISRDQEIAPNVFAGFSRTGDLIEIQVLDISMEDAPWISVDAAAKIARKSGRTTLIRFI